MTRAGSPVAVVCVSGGMDSAVTAAIAARDHRLALLHANYGQKTEARELACFHRLADHYRAESRLVVDFSDLRQIGGSSLTDARVSVREGPPVEGVIPSSYVPFRRMNIRVPSRRYALPLTRTTVAIAAGSPAARATRIASRSRSVSRRSIEPRWHNPDDPATAASL